MKASKRCTPRWRGSFASLRSQSQCGSWSVRAGSGEALVNTRGGFTGFGDADSGGRRRRTGYHGLRPPGTRPSSARFRIRCLTPTSAPPPSGRRPGPRSGGACAAPRRRSPRCCAGPGDRRASRTSGPAGSSSRDSRSSARRRPSRSVAAAAGRPPSSGAHRGARRPRREAGRGRRRARRRSRRRCRSSVAEWVMWPATCGEPPLNGLRRRAGCWRAHNATV
jgi:hypothetical protein